MRHGESRDMANPTRTIVLQCVLVSLLPGRMACGQGHPPDEAAGRMTVAEGFQVELVACEPLVRQPVAIDFDDRGRMWVIQFLQYPNPAGLKRVKIDKYTRVQYDRIPQPPPRGPTGADRITILEDTDGDGRMDRAKDFVDGLNLASGFVLGHGGVFVLQTPYLLFYPDLNRDDIPDGDPEVLLKGFGLDDASAVANSLTWGPDGWLYGCQGSTVTAVIRGIKFAQGIWRYHPVSKKFELFADGGGNMWGLDFDRHGQLQASTNVGGFVMLHMVQGGNYRKKFSKHGPLRNPYALGYFEHVPHKSFHGGHVTVGGIFYQGDAYPSRLRDKYIGADLLGHAIYFHRLHPRASTFRSEHAGELVQANDSWFAPTDLVMGPDGAVYFSDWHDKRTAHPDPDAQWDRSNGRIYRLSAAGAESTRIGALHQMSSDQLVDLLGSSNEWYVRAARCELAARHDTSVWPRLRKTVRESSDDRLVLGALWSLASTGGFTESLAERLLQHRSEHVRSWTVRLLGDGEKVSQATAELLEQLAETDPSAVVRGQLASTAARLPAQQGLPVAHAILLRNEDGNDPHIPLLLWWAVERHAVSAIDEVERRFMSTKAWQQPMIREVILARLMQRYAAEASGRSLAACARLFETASMPDDRSRLLSALDSGLATAAGDSSQKPRIADRVPDQFKARLAEQWKERPTDETLLRLNARLNNRAVVAYARQVAFDDASEQVNRVAMFRFLRQFGDQSLVAPLLELLDLNRPVWLRQAAMDVLSRYANDRVAEGLLHGYRGFESASRRRARQILFARRPWALSFLKEFERGDLDTREVAIGELTALSAHGDAAIDTLVHKHWGQFNTAGSQHKITEIRRVRFDLRGPSDRKRGEALFTKHCATCHQLFGEGKKLGPDLTTGNRKDLEYLLVSIIDPSRFIRKEYVTSIVVTVDGRLLTGMILEETPAQIVLVDTNDQQTVVRRENIEEIRDSPVSLMPENILKPLTPQELRDLFGYLQADGPPLSGKEESQP